MKQHIEKHSNTIRGLLFSIPLVIAIAGINLFIIGTAARAWVKHESYDPTFGASMKREVGLFSVCNFFDLWPGAVDQSVCQSIYNDCSLENANSPYNSVPNPLLGNAFITINGQPLIWNTLPYTCNAFNAVRAFAVMACIFMCATLPLYFVSMCTNHHKVANTLAVVVGYLAAFFGMLAMAVANDMATDPNPLAKQTNFYSFKMFIAGWVMQLVGNSLFAFLSFFWD